MGIWFQNRHYHLPNYNILALSLAFKHHLSRLSTIFSIHLQPLRPTSDNSILSIYLGYLYLQLGPRPLITQTIL